MKYKQVVILVIAGLSLFALYIFAGSSQSRYFDNYENSLEKYDSIWQTLYSYYEDAMPDKIVIKYTNDNASRFDCERDHIKLSLQHFYYSPFKTIGHETSHLALCKVTEKANILEQFRFFDEGLANIMGSQVAQNQEDYKRIAKNAAAIQLNKGNLDFAKVQDWQTYYRANDPGNTYAYHVGASFVFYLLDTFGEEKLNIFFEDIGKTRSLDKSFDKVFSESVGGIEKGWQEYLSQVKIEEMLVDPRIVKMYPKNESKNISANIDEIYVEFNTDMHKGVCIATPCRDSGICYKNAYWKSPRLLAVKVDGKLTKEKYELSLGYPGKCAFKSVAGTNLPITPWTFSTE